MSDTFDTLLSELASERARYEDLRSAGRIHDAISSKSTLHSLRARIAAIQGSWDS